MIGGPRTFDYTEARAMRGTGLTYKAIGEQLGVTAEAVRYACRGAVINRTTTSAATVERRKRQADGHADRQSLRRFAELTAHDPPIPVNGTCAICGKPRHPERSANYAQGCADIDAFCSSTCARLWHENPIPLNTRPGPQPGIPLCGTSVGYRSGCRCDACKQFERTRKAASRARLREGATTMTNRYIVTELAGFLDHDSTEPGVSYHVIDTADNRLAAIFRSEEHDDAQSLAEVRADELNGGLATADERAA